MGLTTISVNNPAMRPDHVGQRVKVCWPGRVYENDAAYVEYDDEGQIIRARKATDAEVQWWLTHTLLETIHLNVQEMLTRY